MSKDSLQRRDFLKLLGLGTATFGLGTGHTNSIAATQRGAVVESHEQYGAFWVERLGKKSLPYEIDSKTIKPMSWKNNVFGRNLWDPLRENRPREDLLHERLVKGRGKVPNQTRLNYALSRASWTVARPRSDDPYPWTPSPNVRPMCADELGPWNPADLDMSWEDASLAVKHAGLFFGASLVGIAELNPLWIYTPAHVPTREDPGRTVPVLSDGERVEQTDEAWYIPKSINRVIVLAFEEDYDAISNSPGQLASAAVGDGYSRMAFTAPTVAEFVRALGYHAIPAGNGLGLSIPMALDAGLGEIGRNGQLITPKYGPRVRLAKVVTNMSLVPDRPISFGVTEFCESCLLCATDCPSRSITEGPRTWAGKSPSSSNGTLKWYVSPESCFDFNDFSCSNCKRVCPFTKPNNHWLHRLIRKTIQGRIGPVNRLMASLDQACGYGRQVPDTEFWELDGQKTITARESM